eukprot:149123-Chlamydomonas_euryale.AAC.1
MSLLGCGGGGGGVVGIGGADGSGGGSDHCICGGTCRASLPEQPARATVHTCSHIHQSTPIHTRAASGMPTWLMGAIVPVSLPEQPTFRFWIDELLWCVRPHLPLTPGAHTSE